MPKLLSLLLCFAMVFSLLALPAQAAKADAVVRFFGKKQHISGRG